MCVRSLRDVRGGGEPASRSGRDVVVRPVLARALPEQRIDLTKRDGEGAPVQQGLNERARELIVVARSLMCRFSLAPLGGAGPHDRSLASHGVLRIAERRSLRAWQHADAPTRSPQALTLDGNAEPAPWTGRY